MCYTYYIYQRSGKNRAFIRMVFSYVYYTIFSEFFQVLCHYTYKGAPPPACCCMLPLKIKSEGFALAIHYICKSSLCVNSLSDAIKSSTSLSCSSNCLSSSFSLSISNSLTYVLALTFDTLVESFNSSIS